MRLRNLWKCRGPNDGTRTLIESILVPEVGEAFRDWTAKAGANCVLIGGVALACYIRPRVTLDVDILFLSSADIPAEVEGFKRTRPEAFRHERTDVEVNVLAPESALIPPDLVQAIKDRGTVVDGACVASPSGLVASKLGRFSLQDRADIDALYKLGWVDLDPYPIPAEWRVKYETFLSEIGTLDNVV